MGEECNMHWGEEETVKGYGGKVGRKETTRGPRHRRRSLKWILEK
jgi:hypothetical protein